MLAQTTFLGNPGFESMMLVVFFFLEGNLQTHFELVLAHSAALCVCLFQRNRNSCFVFICKKKTGRFLGLYMLWFGVVCARNYLGATL